MGLALRVNQSAPSATERELVAAVRTGDDAAFEELFSRYRSRISAYVLVAVGDHGRAEDITQEVFISALRRLRQTERAIAFKPWIYAIAKNACIDEFRRAWRASEISLDEDAEPRLQLASPQPTPDTVVERREQLRDLRGAFRGLSQNHHRILVLRELEGLSYGEIGERMGMSRAMVESTLFRARKRLNQEFKDLESGRRCAHVRAAMEASELSPLHVMGMRERRQVARHLSHCHACRQHAWMVGFDAPSPKHRGLADKIAALLPIGWWRARGANAGDVASQVVRPRSFVATRLMPRMARYSDQASQLQVGRAAAAAAALAVVAAGGGYAVAGSSPNRHAPPKRTPAPITATALAADRPSMMKPADAAATRKPAGSATNGGHGHGGNPAGGSPPPPTGQGTPSRTAGSTSATPTARAGGPASSSSFGSAPALQQVSGGGGVPGGQVTPPEAPNLPSVPKLPGIASPQPPSVGSGTNRASTVPAVAQAAGQTVTAVGEKAAGALTGVTGSGS